MIKLKIGKEYRHVITNQIVTILNIKKDNFHTTVLFTDGSHMSATALREFFKPVLAQKPPQLKKA